MDIKDIFDLIKKHNDLFEHEYRDPYFDVAIEEIEGRGHETWIYVYTKLRKEPSQTRLDKIKKIFNAKDVLWIEGYNERCGCGKDFEVHKPFISIHLEGEFKD